MPERCTCDQCEAMECQCGTEYTGPGAMCPTCRRDLEIERGDRAHDEARDRRMTEGDER